MTGHAWERPLTRRGALRTAALGAAAFGLAGCGLDRSDPDAKAKSERAVKAKVDGDLYYFNWAEYLNPALIKGFEKRYGVRVIESNFDSMQGMLAKLGAGNRYDLIFPTAEWVDRLRKGDQLLRIDHAQLRNYGQITGFTDYFDDPWYDPESAHSVPYSVYTTGICWRADKVGDKLTGSWRDLFDERAKGKIFVLDDVQEAIGMANLLNGFDLNTTDTAQLEQSKQTLIDQKPLLRGYSSDTITTMSSGNAWIEHMWNGDVVNVRNQVSKPENYKYETCKEGIPVGSDTFAIPADAAHPGTALLFIDWLLDPEHAATNIEYFGYPMPNEGGYDAFSRLVKEEPSINVTVEELSKGDQFRNLPREGLQAWNQTWTDVKAA